MLQYCCEELMANGIDQSVSFDILLLGIKRTKSFLYILSPGRFIASVEDHSQEETDEQDHEPGVIGECFQDAGLLFVDLAGLHGASRKEPSCQEGYMAIWPYMQVQCGAPK